MRLPISIIQDIVRRLVSEPHKTQKEIAAAVQTATGPRIHQKDVSEVKNWAEKNRIIISTPDLDGCWQGRVDESVSHELRTRFKLSGALVIECTDELYDSPTKLHAALANSAATEFRPFLADVKHIALGSGRAVMRLAQSLAYAPPQRDDLRISPLAGRLWVGPLWVLDQGTSADERLEQPFDPDYAVYTLARGMNLRQRRRIWISQIAHPLYVTSHDILADTARRHCPFLPGGSWNWNLPAPRFAALGCGPMDRPGGGHRMLRYVESTTNSGINQPYLDKAFVTRFAQARATVEEYGIPSFADLATRLFPVLPLPGEHWWRNENLVKAVAELLQPLSYINSRALSAEWAHYRSINSVESGRVVMLAGSESKWNAIWTVLLANLLPQLQIVNWVVTDSRTAQKLIEAHKALKPDDLAWCNRVLQKAFK